jgi:class 3 adenylate cyclase
LPEAVAAARAMVEGHEAVGREHGLGVKIGVHAGPCLAVRANDRLDFFGTTVNLAARLQAQAHASEVVLTRESYDDPRVRALLEGMPARRFTAALKGIQAVQDLVGVDCGPADVVAAAG